MSTITAKVDFNPYRQRELPLPNINGTNIQVDWGDGSQIETFANGTGNATHSYTNNQNHDYKYEIIITGDITGLGNDAFRSFSYVEVKLPEGITTIGNACFRESRVEQLTIPKTVTSIGDEFNYRNTALKTLTINGNSLTTIGTDFCFVASSLATLKLPDSITNMGVRAFSACTSLKSFTVPKNLTGFSTFAFQNVQLGTLKMGGGPINNPPINENTKIIVPLSKLQDFLNHSSYPNERERYDVFGKNLSEKVYVLGVHLAENLQDKNIVASANDGLTTLANKIPKTVITQPNSRKTSFDEIPVDIRIPQNVTSLKDYCFGKYDANRYFGMVNLRKIELPQQLTSIGKHAFTSCVNLEKIKFTSTTPPTVDETTFSALPTNCIIEVPYSTIQTYQSTQYYPNPKFYHYKETISDSNIGFFHDENNWNNDPKINISQEKITTNDMIWLNSQFTTSQSYILTFDVICTKQNNNGILLFSTSQSLNDSGYYIYSANSKTYVFDGETTSQINKEYLNYGIHRIKIDCLRNNASIEIDGEIVIDNLNVSNLPNTIGLKASDGGNISISNIDLIEYECIYHDKCNSSSNLSNYGSAIHIHGNDKNLDCQLTYNSSGQYYNFGVPGVGTNQSFRPITSLNNKSTSFKVIMKCHGGNSSVGFVAYGDSSNFCYFEYKTSYGYLDGGGKINGTSLISGGTVFGLQENLIEIIPATLEIHVDMENLTMRCIGKWENEEKPYTYTYQIPSNVTKFGLYTSQASNGTYGLGNIYDIKIIESI